VFCLQLQARGISVLNLVCIFWTYLNQSILLPIHITFFLMQVVLGTLLASLVPVVGFNAVMTSEHFASFLVSSVPPVFGLCRTYNKDMSPRTCLSLTLLLHTFSCECFVFSGIVVTK